MHAIVPPLPFCELVLHPPRCEVQKPGLEPALCWIVTKLANVPRHADARLLHHLIRFRFGQPRLERKAADDWPIKPIKLLPAVLVAGLQTLQEARPRLHRVAFGSRHRCSHPNPLTTPGERSFTESSAARLGPTKADHRKQRQPLCQRRDKLCGITV